MLYVRFGDEKLVEGLVSIAAFIDWLGYFPEKKRVSHTSTGHYESSMVISHIWSPSDGRRTRTKPRRSRRANTMKGRRRGEKLQHIINVVNTYSLSSNLAILL